MHQHVAGELTDMEGETSHTLCDNTPVVAWRTKGSTTTTKTTAYLLRIAAIMRKHQKANHKINHMKLSGLPTRWMRKICPILKEERSSSTSKLKESVIEHYLYPALDRAYYVVESYPGDDEQEEDGNKDAPNEKISIGPNTSILDVLDPSIIEDDELLLGIRTRLLQGEVVIIRDTFRREFAEDAWGELNRESIHWEVNPDVKTLHSIPGHSSHKHKPIESTYPQSPEHGQYTKLIRAREIKDLSWIN